MSPTLTMISESIIIVTQIIFSKNHGKYVSCKKKKKSSFELLHYILAPLHNGESLQMICILMKQAPFLNALIWTKKAGFNLCFKCGFALEKNESDARIKWEV